MWCDPLELRPDSELGVPGLLEAARRGSLVTANAFGSGLVESPALPAFLPALCEALLDEPLLLPSAPAWWCGDPLGLAYVLEHLDTVVLRPVDPRATAAASTARADGRPARPVARAAPAREASAWTGQQVLPLSTTPTVAGFGLDAATADAAHLRGRPRGLVRRDARRPGRIVPSSVNPTTGRRDGLVLSKDVWVLKPHRRRGRRRRRRTRSPSSYGPASCRWCRGRWRTCSGWAATPSGPSPRPGTSWCCASLLDEFPFARLDPARGAVDVLARALTHTTGTYPGLADRGELEDEVVDDELRALFLDRARAGSVAQSLEGVAGAAGSVRDQLSLDVFTVLGAIERALAGLAADTEHAGAPAGRLRRRVPPAGDRRPGAVGDPRAVRHHQREHGA